MGHAEVGLSRMVKRVFGGGSLPIPKTEYLKR
jgi:hypothetical protein